MSRLTRKNDDNYNYHLSDYYKYKLIDKLRKLEDIEEELGIDLITLFSALKNGIFISVADGKGNIYYFKTKVKEIKYTDKSLLISSHSGIVNLTDYGKTWALTKEELENDK